MDNKEGLKQTFTSNWCLSPGVFKRIALPDVNVALIDHQDWIRSQHGISDEGITEKVRKVINEVK